MHHFTLTLKLICHVIVPLVLERQYPTSSTLLKWARDAFRSFLCFLKIEISRCPETGKGLGYPDEVLTVTALTSVFFP